MQTAFIRTRLWFLTGVLFVSLWPASVQAIHIIGGDLTMHAVGTTPGLFRFQLNQYWDAVQSPPGAVNRDAYVRLLIYRKQNPLLMDALILNIRETVPLVFENEACAKLRKLSFLEARYYDEFQLDPSRYTDPGGYYIVWERCCRNDALTNAVNPAGVAMTFYLEFPAMQKGGAPFANSSPTFGLPNGDYICLNKPFTFAVSGTDADGDELRYSLVTPLNGYTNRTNPVSSTDAPRSSYPTITWAPGISLGNVIPGNPPLSINPTTGQLSVRATREGLFLFTVQCEEWRNGVRIGLIRRDFQLPVIDCSRDTPPPAVPMVNSQPVQNVVWCASQPLVLTVEKNPIWAYQWQKNGENLRGDTTSTLTVRESGVYTVVRSLAKACANDTVSQGTTVTLVPPPAVKLSVSKAAPYCAGDTMTLRTEGLPGYQYQWRRDGQELPGQQQPALQVSQSGLYTIRARLASGDCDGTDSLRLTLGDRPTVQWDSIAPVCQTNNQPVSLFAQPGGGIYTGLGVTGDRFDPAVAGSGRHKLTYTVRAPNGCQAERSRWVVVAPGLTLTGPTDYVIAKGDSVRLATTADQPVRQYRWEPPTALNRSDIGSPIASPVQTTPYQLTAISTSGCLATRSVRVDVNERLHIPSAFSPNADGMNDDWVIRNIDSFPLCEVTVYNRWGELIFFSRGYQQPWDGTYQRERVNAGLYTYQIRTGPGARGVIYRGQLTILR